MPDPKIKKHASGVYYIHWTEGRRSRCISTREKTMGAAAAFLAEWAKLEREAPKSVGRSLTTAELWALYFDQHVCASVASPKTAETCWKNLAVGFGALTASEIVQARVVRYVADRTNGRIGAPSKTGTIRRELVALRACLNWAANPKRGLIDPSAIRPFDLPPDSAPRDRWLREDEVERLLAAAQDSRLELFLLLALETAARKSAILGLTWSRVDLDIGVIDYRDPTVRQTKKRRSIVPISETLRPALERAYAARTNDFVLGHDGDIYHALKWAARRAGVDDVSPHVLRHTFATWRARRGAPLWLVAKCLGNTQATTERTYAHHCPEDLRAIVNMNL